MPENGQTPAVGYARCSTDKQEKSIAEQVAAVTQYAEQRGYRILRWYKDEGISGDDDKRRVDFKRMLADAQSLGDFEAILCWDQARFGRFDNITAGYYIYPLRQAGVYLATVMEGIRDWNESKDRIVDSVLQEGKHQQLRDHSANVTRGHHNSMTNASWNGTPPYAYRIEGDRHKKRLVLGDAAPVRVVQRIYREFVVEGRSLLNIANRLHADGYPSPSGRGKRWKGDVVRYILANPAYAGDYAGGRTATGKYHRVDKNSVKAVSGRTPRQRRRARSDWIVHPDTHEAIVDRDTWEAAQVRLKAIGDGMSRRTHYAIDENPYLLASILRCGRCGSPM
jgi:DNA invertase Pin-like site-specific DNA recombinase